MDHTSEPTLRTASSGIIGRVHRRMALRACLHMVMGAVMALGTVALLQGVTLDAAMAVIGMAGGGCVLALLFYGIKGDVCDPYFTQISELIAQLRSRGARYTTGGVREVDVEPDSLREWLPWAQRQLHAINRAYHSLEIEREGAQRLLAEKSGERAAFFAQLSHELRSPLNAILGYSSLLIEQVEGDDPGGALPDLQRVHRAGRNLLALIDNLLDMASEGGDRGTSRAKPFDLRSAIAAAVADFRLQNAGCTVQITGEGPPILVSGFCDRTTRAITQMLSEMVQIDSAQDVTVSPEPASADGRVRIRVRINRCEVHAPGSSGHQPGVLQVTKSLVSLLGGELTSVNTSHSLREYCLALPAEPGATRVKKMENLPTAQIVPHPRKKSVDGSKTALVVDDDPAAADLLSRWLRRCGYHVLTATDADSGLEIARREQPDLVLLDALMPGRSGYEVLPEMRADPMLADTPILIVTVDDDRERGLEAGASDFVRKPVTESGLRSLVSIYDTDASGEVLIIEDDADAAELLSRTVSKLGFSTRIAGNGIEGLAAVKERLPKAIMLDLNMPQLNGFEFIEQLTADDGLAGIPLIVVSGEDLSLAQHDKLVAAGCRFYLKGSAAPREIAEGLREAVG